MLFRPKNYKFNKQVKGRKFNKVYGILNIKHLFNPIKVTVLKALNYARVTEKQLLAIRQTLARKLKKKGKSVIKLLADVPLTKKPLEIRMGKGKGSVDVWVAKVRPGMPIIEMRNMSLMRGRRLLNAIKKKLPIKTKIEVIKSLSK